MEQTSGKIDRILRLPEVCARGGFKKSHLYEMVKRGEFPASLRLSKRIVGWRESEVEAWIKSRPAAISDVRERGLSAA
jgi:prophage regulatory protein